MDYQRVISELCALKGISGDEKQTADYLKTALQPYMPTYVDCMGNVIGQWGKGENGLLLDAHMDQVGLIVCDVDEEGFILFERCGHIDKRILVGHEVVVHGKRDLFGIICSIPPHLRPKDEQNEVDCKALAVDVGMSKQQVLQSVGLGDRISLRINPILLQNNRISAAGLDDKCGAVAILGAVERLAKENYQGNLIVMFSTREEIGCIGAETGSFSLAVSRAIVVDVGFGGQPGVEGAEAIALKKGVSIGIAPILDSKMQNELVGLCQKHAINYQHDVMNGRTGTNADTISITQGGVRCALLSVPLRNMHTGVEVADIEDIRATSDLLYHYVKEGSR